jgi:hypothetical protein
MDATYHHHQTESRDYAIQPKKNQDPHKHRDPGSNNRDYDK